MKNLKRGIYIYSIPLVAIFILGSCTKKYPPSPHPRDIFSKHATIINDSIGLPNSEQFRNYFIPILHKLEYEAPNDVKDKLNCFVDIKKGLIANYDYPRICMLKSAEDLANMGSYARGASYKLTLVLGDNALIMPGDIPRIFGATGTSLGQESKEALISIGEWSIISLIMSLDIKEYKNDSKAYSSDLAKTWACVALNKITDQNLPYFQDIWIAWFMDKYANTNYLSKIIK